MKRIALYSKTLAVLLLLLGALEMAHARDFKAVGNADPDHQAERRKKGEVVVTFDKLRTKMSFNLPAAACLVTENNISYLNSWAETYDPAAGDGSCEPLMDRDNVYSRMWIESQNDARIVVRWRAALVSSDGIIAHKDAPAVSPYGPGDWVDEWYIIYPDGVHVRKSQVYSHFAPQAKPFGWDREPPNYIFEFQEMSFQGRGGHLPEDDIQTKALTLIKMDGTNTTISYDPYPIHFNPTEEELYASFGDFRDANIFVVNTKSQFHPFTIGREEGVSISPYAPETETLKGTFQQWPYEPDKHLGYIGVSLGHMVLRTFYRQTDTTLTQIYLSGFVKGSKPERTLVPLAKSWLHAPAITLGDGSAGESYGYDPAQRAYLLDTGQGSEGVAFTITASQDSPVVNPALLINNWGEADPTVEVNGSPIAPGPDCRIGRYEKLDVDDGRDWKNALVVWLKLESTEETNVKISPAE